MDEAEGAGQIGATGDPQARHLDGAGLVLLQMAAGFALKRAPLIAEGVHVEVEPEFADVFHGVVQPGEGLVALHHVEMGVEPRRDLVIDEGRAPGAIGDGSRQSREHPNASVHNLSGEYHTPGAWKRAGKLIPLTRPTPTWRSGCGSGEPPHVSGLLGVAVRRLGGHLQLIVDLIQQILGPLSVALHIPFIRLLSVHDLLPSLAAQLLRRREIRMASGVDILLRPLPNGNASNEQQNPQTAERIRVLVMERL